VKETILHECISNTIDAQLIHDALLRLLPSIRLINEDWWGKYNKRSPYKIECPSIPKYRVVQCTSCNESNFYKYMLEEVAVVDTEKLFFWFSEPQLYIELKRY
jgi:hypothetical protein